MMGRLAKEMRNYAAMHNKQQQAYNIGVSLSHTLALNGRVHSRPQLQLLKLSHFHFFIFLLRKLPKLIHMDIDGIVAGKKELQSRVEMVLLDTLSALLLSHSWSIQMGAKHMYEPKLAYTSS